MLKLFYKTLLVSVLSCSLLMLDFNMKGLALNSAMSETVKTEKINDKDLMGTLTMTVVGVLAKRLYTYKPTPDIMLAAAGGAIFLAGEVMAYVKLKDVMKGMEEEITRDKNGNVNKEQLESLERLKKSYVEAKKTANTKKTLQMAAAAAFAAAAVVAYTAAAKDVAVLTTCTTGIGTGLSAATGVKTVCAGYASNPYTAAEGARCFAELATCTAAVTLYETTLMSYEMGRQATGPSVPLLTKAVASEATLTTQLATVATSCPTYTQVMGAPVGSACTALVPNNVPFESSGVIEAGGAAAFNNIPDVYKKMLVSNGISEKHFLEMTKYNHLKTNKFLNSIIDFFMPQAKAELFSAMGIASSLAITYILATSATLGPSIDMFMLIPQKRAIVWGILGALTAAATMSTNNVISQIDANIKKIDDILKSMYTMSDGATGTQIATPALATGSSAIKPVISSAPNANNYEDIDLSNSINGTLPCGTGPENEKCKSFEDSVKDLPSYQGLDAESQLQLSSIMKTASGLSGTSTISKGTLTSASTAGAASNALNAAAAKAKAKVANALKASGSKVDLDKQSKDLSDSIQKAMNDNLKKSNSTASGMLASFSGGAGSSASSTVSDAAAKKAEADALAAALARAKGAGTAGAVNINAGSTDKMDLGMTGLDTGEKKYTAEELAALNATTKNAANIDDYDIKNDISKDSGANIFELISNRYQQSGYPRLFKLKEPAPAAANAVKN